MLHKQQCIMSIMELFTWHYFFFPDDKMLIKKQKAIGHKPSSSFGITQI